MNPRRLKRLCGHLAIVAATAAMTFAGATAAAAQYQWRDSQGRMVYSDLPPPPSVAPSRIIRAPEAPRGADPSAVPPGQNPAAQAATGAGVQPVTAARSSPPAASDAGLSIADREMAYRKRLADRAEDEKKAMEASRRKLELARACNDARGDIRSLESGQRISRINAAGEREFLSDAERSERMSAARKSVSERC